MALGTKNARAPGPAALLVAALALCACAEPAVEHERPGFLGAAPVDGTTGLSDLAVQVYVSRSGRPLSEVERTTFAAGLGLATWPELLPVPSTVTVTAAASMGPTTPDTFVVAPQSPLPEGWYVASVAQTLPDVNWASPFDHHAIDGGASGMRVRIGSEPAVWGIDFCAKEASTYVVYVTFSEPIANLNAVDLPSISVQVAGRPCAAMGGDNPAPNTRRGFRCTEAGDSDVFTIVVGDGLKSPQGIAVAPGNHTASPASLPVAPSGCRTYKVAP